MKLLKEYKVNVPKGYDASTAEEAFNIAKNEFSDVEMRKNPLVVKAQVLAGGRGKGVFKTGFKGGVHKAHS